MSAAVHHWNYQRMSASALFVLFPLILYFFFSSRDQSYDNWLRQFADPIFLTFFITTLHIALYHACLGLQMIIEDYIPHKMMRKMAICWCFGLCGFLGLLTTICALRLMMLGISL